MKISTYFLLLFTLFFTACGGGGSEKSPTNSAQFLTVSFAPAATDQAISTEKIVTVTFSGVIDSSTVDATSVYIEDDNSTQVPASITVIGNKISIIPTDYFSEFSRYALVVTSTVSDIDGLKLKDDFTFSFTTSTGPDISPPSLVAYTPTPGTSVAPSSHIIMTFDETIIADETGLFELIDSDANQTVVGVTTVGDHEISFAPVEALSYDGNYTARLLGSVTDVAGNVYNGNVTDWTFSIDSAPDTLAPSLLSLTPADGTSADKATTIIMAFDEVIANNTAVLEVSFRGTNTVIAGTSTIENNIVSFVPDSELIPEEDYTVTLQDSVLDLAGNTYTGVTSWEFSVNPLADTTAPTLLSVTPADGTSADETTEIIMAFDEVIADNGASLEVRDSATDLVVGTSTITNNILTFAPNNDLIPGEDYTVTLLGSVQDAVPNTYVGVTSWDFSVNPLVDSTAPSMVSLTPADGTSADRATDVIISFDEELANNAASLEVRDSGSDLVVGSSTITNNTLTFVPDSDLIPGEDYTVTLQGTVLDLAGNSYTGVTSWDFATDPVVGTGLTVTNIKYKSDNKITIEFYEKLDNQIVSEADFLLNGGAIAFTDFKFKDGDWQVELKAVTTLVGTETITVSGTVQDKSGNVHNSGFPRDYSIAGVLSVWDVKMKDDKVTVKFWEIADLPSGQDVLDPSTIDASDFQINGGAISFSGLEIKDYEVKFTADTPLSGDEVITIFGGIQDLAGNYHNYNVAVMHTFR